MQADAVNHYHWMTNAASSSTPSSSAKSRPDPWCKHVAVVGYAAAGIAGWSPRRFFVAFTPSFTFVLLGALQVRDGLPPTTHAHTLYNGAGPAAIGAILGSAVPLGRALGQPWQLVILVGAAALLFLLHRSAVITLLLAAAAGILVVALGAPLPL